MSFLKNIIGQILPPPSESKFLEKGMLIPQEFITAGDQLVHTCPTWQWKPAIDSRHKRSELPEDKQYLYTRVPCSKRVNKISETRTIEKDLGDGWSLAEAEESISTDPIIDVQKLDALKIDNSKESKLQEGETHEEKGDDDDEIKVKVSAPNKESEEEDEDFIAVEGPTGTETRYYELTITYDFYYLTPRLWLSGYTEDNYPLSDKEMFEDIMDDYANKTVTYETQPHIGINQLGIHPCKHSNVMKYLIDVASENGVSIQPHQALFVFLKFISSVVPTMEYDFTIDVELSAQK